MSQRIFQAPLKHPVHDREHNAPAHVWRQWFTALTSLFNASGVVTTPTVTASPYTYTNSTNAPQLVLIVGGTVSAVSIVRAGTSYALVPLPSNVLLAGGDGITITYSVAPTVRILPL